MLGNTDLRATGFVLFFIGAVSASCARGHIDEGADPVVGERELGPPSRRDPEPAPEKEGPPTPCALAAAKRSPLGCEYAIPTPGLAGGACAALLVSNPSEVPARLTALHGGSIDLLPSMRLLTGKGHEPGFSAVNDSVLPPHASAVLALADAHLEGTTPKEVCPITPLADRRSFFREENPGTAFFVRSDRPIFAAYFASYGSSRTGSTATALRSAGSWDRDYLDVGVHLPGRAQSQAELPGGAPGYFTTPSGAIVATLPPTSLTLQKDPFAPRPLSFDPFTAYHFRRDDLHIGTSMKADEPFALFVGSAAAAVPFDTGVPGPMIVQVPPPSAWTNEYAAVGHPSRSATIEDPPLYRIFAEQSGTTLTYEPSPPPGAPLTVDAGAVAAFRAREPFVVRSQDEAHRFYVSVAMTGAMPLCESVRPSDDDPEVIHRSRCPGGPALVNVTAPAEYATRFAFTTVHTHADVHLVLVRKKSGAAFAEVKLDCAGTVEGWTPIGAGGAYETATVTLSEGNFAPRAHGSGTCGLGAHTMSSDGSFTGYVWGWTHEGVDGLASEDDGSHRSYGFAFYGE